MHNGRYPAQSVFACPIPDPPVEFPFEGITDRTNTNETGGDARCQLELHGRSGKPGGSREAGEKVTLTAPGSRL
jgi:hypothetical protein